MSKAKFKGLAIFAVKVMAVIAVSRKVPAIRNIVYGGTK